MADDKLAAAASADVGAPDTSGEERLLAGVAHVALFGGLFVIGPLAIYFYKRRTSPFVAFHAAQATIVSLLLFGFVGAAWTLLVPLVLLIGWALSSMPQGVAMVGVWLIYLAMALLAALPLIIAVTAAWRAFHGRTWSIPIIGRIARGIVAQDEKR